MKAPFLYLLLTLCVACCVPAYAKDMNALFSLLQTRNYEELEAATKQVQTDLENGDITEIELRNLYRQFYNLDSKTLGYIDEWKARYPKSYAAYLIRGTYFKRAGADARGSRYISQTGRTNINSMHRYMEIAESELKTSLTLTKIPFLSLFQLLEVSRHTGNHKAAFNYMKKANEVLPGNTLARNRYFFTLKPRWGGSYEKMQAFIAQTEAEDVSPSITNQLKAIMLDDIAFTQYERRYYKEAFDTYFQALELASKERKEFLGEFLSHSDRIRCHVQSLAKFCQREM